MSTSGTTAFTLVNNEFCERAFALLGIGQEGESITAKMYSDATYAFNLMIKTFSAKDHLWSRAGGSLTLISGQAAYALGGASGKPMRVLSARRKTTASGNEVPMTEWSRQEYLDQPNKTSSLSTPTSFYYDPQRATGTLYVWPAPSTAVASTMTIEYDYLRRLSDMISSSDEADFPQEWLETLVYNLAVRLMPQYPVNDGNLAKLVIGQAQELLAGMSGWDEEPASVFLQPDARW